MWWNRSGVQHRSIHMRRPFGRLGLGLEIPGLETNSWVNRGWLMEAKRRDQEVQREVGATHCD